MPRNGSGTYAPPVNSWNQALTGPATPTDWQALLNDIIAAITQSISKDGQTPITSPISFDDVTVVDFTYSGALTGGTGVVNIGSGQIVKRANGAVGIGVNSDDTVKLYVTGTDNTSSNLALLVARADGQQIASFRNDHRVSLGNGSFILDPAGNAALGGTPSDWTMRALQIGGFGAISGDTNTVALSQNVYGTVFSGFGATYAQTGQRALTFALDKADGSFKWSSSDVGVAGAAITLNRIMTLTPGGNLLLTQTRAYNASADIYLEVGGTDNGYVNTGAISSWRQYVAGDANGQPLRFEGYVRGTGWTEAARITSARYTKCSSDGTYIASTGVYHEHVQSSTTATDRVRGTWHKATAGDNIFDTFFTEGTATARGSIDYNRAGGAVRYNTTSDGNLKNIKNPASLQDSVDLIMSIPIDEWAWKDDPNQWSQIGPIAQKLHQVFPGAVSVGGEYEETIPAVTQQRLLTEAVVVDGIEVEPATYETVVIEPERTVTKYRAWGVDKTAPVWHLVATCQKQQATIQAQQSQIESILARLDALESN